MKAVTVVKPNGEDQMEDVMDKPVEKTKTGITRVRAGNSEHFNGVDLNSVLFKKKFVRNIKAIGRYKGMSTSNITRGTGMSYSYIYNLEKGTAGFDRSRLESFAKVCKVRPEFLATLQDLSPHEISGELDHVRNMRVVSQSPASMAPSFVAGPLQHNETPTLRPNPVLESVPVVEREVAQVPTDTLMAKLLSDYGFAQQVADLSRAWACFGTADKIELLKLLQTSV
jgi:transcriptional regulator with XRE-family HTH domain